MPRQAKAASAAASRQLEQPFPEVERLLSQRVDKLVWQFRASTPEFYEKYQVARTGGGARDTERGRVIRRGACAGPATCRGVSTQNVPTERRLSKEGRLFSFDAIY